MAECKLMRAIRLVYRCDRWLGRKEEQADLPDRIALPPLKVSSALEYVAWEVPWMPSKLFRVVRRDGSDAVDAVYTGQSGLVDRQRSKYESWTDESIFDHMGLTVEGK